MSRRILKSVASDQCPADLSDHCHWTLPTAVKKSMLPPHRPFAIAEPSSRCSLPIAMNSPAPVLPLRSEPVAQEPLRQCPIFPRRIFFQYSDDTYPGRTPPKGRLPPPTALP